MSSIKIGAICTPKNHPYQCFNTEIKIAGFAQMTPPLLVVSEIQNYRKEYDTENGQLKPQQAKCVYYSHKTHKFESYWLNIEQLKVITIDLEPVDHISNNEITVTTDTKDLANSGVQYFKSTSIEVIKKKFLNNIVVLKSCDYELGKQKTTFEKNNQSESRKINGHLDFLPPVLTVTDVIMNDEKIIHNKNTGMPNKICSNFLLKCKYYNPSTGGFSEHSLPIEVVNLVEVETENTFTTVNKCITQKLFIKQPLKSEIVLEGTNNLEHTYIQPLELIFNHYKYKLKYFDFFKNSYSEISLSDLDLQNKMLSLDNIVLLKIPEYNKKKEEFDKVEDYDFVIGEFYRITYKDTFDRITRRIILVKEFIKNKIVIADCLLRNGEERHFRIKDAILKVEILEQEIFENQIDVENLQKVN